MEETPICASVERDLEIRLDDLLSGVVDAPSDAGPSDAGRAGSSPAGSAQSATVVG